MHSERYWMGYLGYDETPWLLKKLGYPHFRIRAAGRWHYAGTSVFTGMSLSRAADYERRLALAESQRK